MIYLGELLSYLDRGEADEVVMQSGQPPRLRVGEEDRALGDDPLSRDAILAALHGAAVGSVIPRNDTAGEVQVVQIRGRAYLINVARFLDLLEVRVAAVPAPERAAHEVAAIETRRPTLRHMPAMPPDPGSDRPTQREGANVGPLVAAALDETSGGDHPTRREGSVVGPLAAAALELPPREVVHAARPPELDARARVPHPAARPPGPSTRTAPGVPAPMRDDPTPIMPVSPPMSRADPRAYAGTVGLPRIGSDHDRSITHARGPDAALPDTVADILAAARAEGATDAHLCSELPVRVRVAGRLEERGILVDHALLERTVSTCLLPSQAAQLAERGHVNLLLADPRAGRLRINLCRQRNGLKLCARLVAPAPPTRQDIGLPVEAARVDLLHQGLVVIAGPSGHGKTTTMATLVDALASTRAIHIITVEDPVEIVHPIKRALVTQREIGRHTKSFATALSAALREDPDVIAIGELRDRETVEMALAAAETGHLVLATMNTPSGAKTIERLIELFPPDDQSQVRATLCGALVLVISQRLLPRKDGTGQVAAFEVITGGPPLWGLIRDRKLHQLPSLLQRGKAFGMRRIEESLRELVLRGAISEEVALSNAEDPRALAGGDPTIATTWNPSSWGER